MRLLGKHVFIILLSAITGFPILIGLLKGDSFFKGQDFWTIYISTSVVIFVVMWFIIMIFMICEYWDEVVIGDKSYY